MTRAWAAFATLPAPTRKFWLQQTRRRNRRPRRATICSCTAGLLKLHSFVIALFKPAGPGCNVNNEPPRRLVPKPRFPAGAGRSRHRQALSDSIRRIATFVGDAIVTCGRWLAGLRVATMSMKRILVPIQNHDAIHATLETALLLARRCDSDARASRSARRSPGCRSITACLI